MGFEPTISAGERPNLRLRPRGHWDRGVKNVLNEIFENISNAFRITHGLVFSSQLNKSKALELETFEVSKLQRSSTIAIGLNRNYSILIHFRYSEMLSRQLEYLR